MECMHGQISGLQHQLKESEGHVQALGMEKAQQQDAHRKEACELATGLEEVRLTLTDAFKQFERNSKKAQEDEDTITRLREELKASKEELAASEAERASAQPELSTPQQGLSALQDQLTTSQAENEDTLRQLFERSQELGSLHAGILWYQRMLAELHTELEQYRENAQIARSQLQHLDMLRQQSEAELIEKNEHLGSLQVGILGYQRVVAELHAELAPCQENLQSIHCQLQDLQVLHQQSEAKLIDRNLATGISAGRDSVVSTCSGGAAR
uniref:Centrosomal protein of 85 kDa-like n=1 Tax=Petromyzon marinus TaxID=7757 RepID=A0AAJ7SKD1_PETMA|nr:centrosomal protein of 85 kDa-like [Petromyzon marinus]